MVKATPFAWPSPPVFLGLIYSAGTDVKDAVAGLQGLLSPLRLGAAGSGGGSAEGVRECYLKWDCCNYRQTVHIPPRHPDSEDFPSLPHCSTGEGALSLKASSTSTSRGRGTG